MSIKNIRDIFDIFCMYSFDYYNSDAKSVDEAVLSLEGCRFDEIPKLRIISEFYLVDIIDVLVMGFSTSAEENDLRMLLNDTDILLQRFKENNLRSAVLMNLYQQIVKVCSEGEADEIYKIIKFICIDFFLMNSVEIDNEEDFSLAKIKQKISRY